MLGKRTLMGKLGIACLWVVVAAGCAARPETSKRGMLTAEQNDSLFSHTYDSVTDKVLDISIPVPMRKVKTLLFSNIQAPDTFELLIPAGPILKTQSQFRIKTADNRVIYMESCDSRFFTYGIFEPDTLPRNGSRTDDDAYMLKYAASLTRERVEGYFRQSVDRFFEDVSPVKVQDSIVGVSGDISDDANITEPALYREALADTARKVVSMGCLGCEEGFEYLCYSPKEEKAKVILAMD